MSFVGKKSSILIQSAIFMYRKVINWTVPKSETQSSPGTY